MSQTKEEQQERFHGLLNNVVKKIENEFTKNVPRKIVTPCARGAIDLFEKDIEKWYDESADYFANNVRFFMEDCTKQAIINIEHERGRCVDLLALVNNSAAELESQAEGLNKLSSDVNFSKMLQATKCEVVDTRKK
jgi:hypothetical protein|tara:strand:+ start:25918 stop:26325 length:408 start_codon:yes stop_codon:yes gene_type:complete